MQCEVIFTPGPLRPKGYYCSLCLSVCLSLSGCLTKNEFSYSGILAVSFEVKALKSDAVQPLTTLLNISVMFNEIPKSALSDKF